MSLSYLWGKSSFFAFFFLFFFQAIRSTEDFETSSLAVLVSDDTLYIIMIGAKSAR